MAGEFDPYHKWLGIPPDEQPPNHYRLLGLAEYESDPDAIDAASEQRMIFLQTVAHGPHVEQSQELLNRVAAARLCLLDKAKKTTYDGELRAARPPQLNSGNSQDNSVAARSGPPPLTVERAIGEFVPLEPPAVPGGVVRQSSVMLWICGGSAVAVVLTIIIVAVVVATRKDESEAKIVIVWPLGEREGAGLFVNDEPRRLGDKRRIELNLSPGTHRIRMRRKGYRDIVKTVKLTFGKRFEFDLVWISATKIVIVWPLDEREGAELLVDDKPRGLADERRIELKLSPGIYRIRMRRKGYWEIARTVQLKMGKVIVFDLVWKKE